MDVYDILLCYEGAHMNRYGVSIRDGARRPSPVLACVIAALAWALALSAVQADELAVSESVPPGRLVSVGTHRLQIYCTGHGSPTVILESGLGEVSLVWSRVQSALSRDLQVCSYDRAGYAWSDRGPGPRTASVIVDDLHTLLANAGVEPPYILVGHSFGGYIVQLYASRYPKQTAGVVLVDSSHPEQVQRFLEPPIRLNTAPTGNGTVLNYSMPTLPPSMPPNLRTLALQLMLQWKTRLAMTNEFLHFRESAREVEDAEPLPDVPLVVLTRGERVFPKGYRGELMERLWMELQDELAKLSPQSAHLIATKSGHNIELDQPELVADAVILVTDVVRTQNSLLAHSQQEFGPVTRTWYAFDNATWESDTLHLSLNP